MVSPTDKQILHLAAPSIVSNITVPLLGLVDVAIVGHMGHPAYIGAVAVGSMMFNLLYWLFSFLRMGTSGLTAQALGRRDMGDLISTLARSATAAAVSAAALTALQGPLLWVLFWLIAPTPDVAPLAADYFRIVIWGAPASLGLFALTGWFVGMQNTRAPMFVSIMQNVVNIVASVALVYGAGMKIQGVALGTVVAQYAGLAAALVLLWRRYGGLLRRHAAHATLRRRHGDRHGSHVNRDIFLRTLCLVAANLCFTSAGARQGAVILSVNTVLMQLYLFFSYFMDGFAYAGEALCGRSFGACDGRGLRQTLRRLFGWMGVVTACFTLLYALGGMPLVAVLTDEPEVVGAAADYIGWAVVIPLAGCAAFIWDGVFVGLTATRGMLWAGVVGLIGFIGVYGTLGAAMGNHALWLAQAVFLGLRAVVQTVWWRRRLSAAVAALIFDKTPR